MTNFKQTELKSPIGRGYSVHIKRINEEEYVANVLDVYGNILYNFNRGSSSQLQEWIEKVKKMITSSI
jgi:hypothetical protein